MSTQEVWKGASMVGAFLLGTIAPLAMAQSPCVAQGPARQNQWPISENRGAAALAVALRQFHTRASMLMITAHPDDEDGGALAYEARDLGADVSLLTLNRGGGGADIMSSDLWDSLALVRTEELLQADRYYCVNQYFTVAADYGFSKSLAEAIQKWGENGATFADVVRVVRLTRPLVVTSVFVGGPSDGHGNHAAAGKWAQKVFLAAGNPKVFPDQIREGLRPWNPLKEYARVPFSLEQGHVSPRGLYDYATHHWLPAGVQNYITGKWEPGGVPANVEIPEGAYLPLDASALSRSPVPAWAFRSPRTAVPSFLSLVLRIPPIIVSDPAFQLRTTRIPSSMVSTFRCPASPISPDISSTPSSPMDSFVSIPSSNKRCGRSPRTIPALSPHPRQWPRCYHQPDSASPEQRPIPGCQVRHPPRAQRQEAAV